MRIIVAGSGIAGIGAALALAGPGREVTVVDRDPPPPGGDMNEVFEVWDRKGATQLRHSHVFLARLFNLIRDRYPELLRRLFAAGARELSFQDALPPTLRQSYVAQPGDKDLSILSCRRTTLEAVMRAYAGEQAGVAFLSGRKVRGLVLDRSGAIPRATGLRIERDPGEETLTADIVVDASGRNSPFPDWLAGEGVAVPSEESPAGILYYTRHYRLVDGTEPERKAGDPPGAGDMGYIKYGVFPADDGNFSITLSVPEIETELRQQIVDPAVFDAICAVLPGVAKWTNASRSRATSKVFAMGNLKNVWRRWVVDDRPAVLGFFAIGDATIRTNPLYGRGCSLGFMLAHLLADVLKATDDPGAQAKFFAAKAEREARPFYDMMVRQDEAAIRRAVNAQNPNYRPRLRSRLIKSFAEDAVIPATRGDIRVLRAVMRGFHMLEGPNEWLARPDIVARVLSAWARPKRMKAHLYPGSLGPEREELLAIAREARQMSAAA